MSSSKSGGGLKVLNNNRNVSSDVEVKSFNMSIMFLILISIFQQVLLPVLLDIKAVIILVMEVKLVSLMNIEAVIMVV